MEKIKFNEGDKVAVVDRVIQLIKNLQRQQIKSVKEKAMPVLLKEMNKWIISLLSMLNCGNNGFWQEL